MAERPDESEPEARAVWDRVKEATGYDPPAMFRRGKGKRTQYCILSIRFLENGTSGWSDAEWLIKSAISKRISIARSEDSEKFR